MTISERILLSLSRKPNSDDYLQKDEEDSIDNALDLLTRVFPDFNNLVSGKRVVDFGCGIGYQSIALVKKLDCSVIGVDSNRQTIQRAIDHAKYHSVSSNDLRFVTHVSSDMLDSFDVVISQNSFEHFPDPAKILCAMSKLLNHAGLILLTFGPPWFAPYGSHMHFFCRIPWINVLFSEASVMQARSHFRSDGAKRYEDVESGLNQMTVARFESIISSSGLAVKFRKYECVKKLNWLSKVPMLREFFINHITVVLSKAS